MTGLKINKTLTSNYTLKSMINNWVEEVALYIGFSDRHHFSRVFKSVTGTTPAVYKSGKFS